jgi:hypothetical protein
MANILLEIGKGIEVGAEDLLKFFAKAQTASPAVLAALGTLATGVTKALSDVQAGAAASPLAALINAPAELTDFEAVWPEVVKFFATLGIKV